MKSKIEFTPSSKIEEQLWEEWREARPAEGGDYRRHVFAPPSTAGPKGEQILFHFLEEIPLGPKDSGRRAALSHCYKTIISSLIKFNRNNQKKK
jgi:hypothetical protein